LKFQEKTNKQEKQKQKQNHVQMDHLAVFGLLKKPSV